MTEAMQAIVFHGPGQLALEEFPRPRIQAADDVLLRVERVSICGTDIHILSDPPGHPATPGSILGHEYVATVTDIGESVPANSERASALTVMENILTSNPDLNAVFATSDQMALGAMEGVAAQHLNGKIVVVGFDAGKEAVRAVKSGAISAVIAQYPANMGKQAVEAAIKAIRGEPVAKVIDTGTALVTKENADEFLK